MSKTRQLSDAINSVDISQSAPDDAVTLDASGNLLVGKTAISGTTVGFEARENGLVQSVRDGGLVMRLYRQTSDGDIVEFRKDDTTVGQINTVNSDMIIGSNDVGLYFDSVNDQIRPATAVGNTVRGSAIDLGRAAGGFKDLYLSGGVFLGGTGAANYLDDYERGQHDPDGSNDAGDASFTYDGRHGGHYIKVGASVTYYFRFETDSVTAGTADSHLRISLPFVVSGDDDGGSASEFGGGPIFYHGNSGTGVAVAGQVGNAFMKVRTSALGDALMNTDDLASGFNVLQGVIHYYTES